MKPDIYSVIDGWDDIDSSVKNFLDQFTERELKEIYIMLEDPYSTENLVRAQEGIEYKTKTAHHHRAVFHMTLRRLEDPPHTGTPNHPLP